MNRLTIFIIGFIFLWGCGDDNPSGPSADDFDRQAILENWADNIIIPSFQSFAASMNGLESAANGFTSAPTVQSLENLRSAWRESYLSWQHVSMFEMGRAMDIRYRDNMNIYPVNVSELEENIMDGDYNLELPSENDQQGFPALDYLLNGLSETDAGILEYYTTNEQSEAYKKYISDVVNRMKNMTDEVLTHWQSGYRDEFVSNDGNGANASLDMMVNDYIYYYEKVLRAGKIGIPAGVFSGTPLKSHVEAYYSNGFSKDLFLEALDASQNFFNGRHFNSQQTGESLASYLDYLNTMKNGADLTQLINDQFESVRTAAQPLSKNFAEQVETDNTVMLTTYDELQKNVVLLKVDMLQALNINVDYVDADGD